MKTSLLLLRAAALATVLGWLAYAQDPQPAPAAEPTPPASAVQAAPPAPPAPPAPEPVKAEIHVRAKINEAPFGNHTVPVGETAPELVSIFGNSDAAGDVDRDVVSVFGNSNVSGKAGGDTVSVFGNSTVSGDVARDVVSVFGNTVVSGTAGHDVVAVFGNVIVQGRVDHDVVAVLGNIHLAPGAIVNGNPIAVGGTVHRDSTAFAGADIRLSPQDLLERMGGVGAWIQHCLLKARLLGYGHGVAFAWIFGLAYLGLYLVTALLFPRATAACTEAIRLRPGTIILSSLIAMVALPLLYLLLMVTVVGLLLIPVLALAVFAGKTFGHAALRAWLGGLITRSFAPGAHIVLPTLIGGLLVLLAYSLPVFSWMLFALLGFLSLGVTIAALIERRRMRKEARAAAAPAPTPEPQASAPAAGMPPPLAMGFAAAPVAAEAPAEIPQPATEPAAAAIVPALTLPHADFWPRMGALVVDLILVSLLVAGFNGLMPNLLHIHMAPGFATLLLMATYGCLMWKWRGTTVGGLLFRLKVVRNDGRALDWPTCVVRGLGCILSAFVLFLGFIWIAIDRDREGWHDKIAGTCVVRVPRQESLV